MSSCDADDYYEGLWDWIMDGLGVMTVLDAGSGECRSTEYFRYRGCRILGMGASATPIMGPPAKGNPVGRGCADGPYVPGGTYDLAWSCMSVDEGHTQNLLDAFRNAGRYVFISDAAPPQPGRNRGNLQEPAYWVERMAGVGFSFDYDLTVKARRMAGRGCFADTGLVFARDMPKQPMADNPMVTVVLCTYNRKQLLVECIGAILSQTYSRFEIVVVDDGSDDGTGDAIGGFPVDGRIKFLRQSHLGLASARNVGIENSKGGIVCFIDDDCIADRRWLQNIVGAYSDGDIGGVGGRIINHEPWTTPKTLLERFLHKSGLYQQRYVGEFLVGANSSYRRAALEAVNGFDGSLLKDEDADIGMRIIATGMRFAYAPKAMVYHRTRGGFRGLLAQVYGYGTGHMMVYRKYPSRHSVARQVLRRLGSIVLNAIRTPIRLAGCLWQDDMTLYVMEPLINSAILTAETAGIISELIMPTKPQRT